MQNELPNNDVLRPFPLPLFPPVDNRFPVRCPGVQRGLVSLPGGIAVKVRFNSLHETSFYWTSLEPDVPFFEGIEIPPTPLGERRFLLENNEEFFIAYDYEVQEVVVEGEGDEQQAP